MTTKLAGDLRRELLIGQQAYTLTISPHGFVLALKGRRKGLEIAWADLVSGDVAMATALNASLSANIQPKQPGPTPTPAKRPATTGEVGKGRKSGKRLRSAS